MARNRYGVPGRIRHAVAEKLRSLGCDVWAEDIRVAEGYNRIYGYFDDTTLRWEVYERGKKRWFVSYDTLTDCTRGFTLHPEDGFMVWVYADNPIKKARKESTK